MPNGGEVAWPAGQFVRKHGQPHHLQNQHREEDPCQRLKTLIAMKQREPDAAHECDGTERERDRREPYVSLCHQRGEQHDHRQQSEGTIDRRSRANQQRRKQQDLDVGVPRAGQKLRQSYEIDEEAD